MTKVLIKFFSNDNEDCGFAVINKNEIKEFEQAVIDNTDYYMNEFIYQDITEEHASILETLFPGGFGYDFLEDVYATDEDDNLKNYVLGAAHVHMIHK